MSADGDTASVIEVRELCKTFRGRGGAVVKAVNHVSCAIGAGQTVGLIGESGSGKSTLGKLMLGLTAPDSGEVVFEGRSLASLSRQEMRRLRSSMQVVFQEPYASLNPRLKIKSIIAEPLVVQGVPESERSARVTEAMERVELSSDLANRYPIQLSGGQQQRVGIARAVVGRPKFVVLDEPTASLDRTIRRHIASLLMDLQAELGLAYLLITHDIASVRRMAATSMVMYRGHLVEEGHTRDILTNPAHPYTRALISAELVARPGARNERYLLKPRLPNAELDSPGCPLVPVCPLVVPACSAALPPMTPVTEDHRTACIRWSDVKTDLGHRVPQPAGSTSASLIESAEGVKS